MSQEIIVKVDNLTKKYRSLVAVDNVSFTISQGEIFGLLGENGAGKTTTLEMIEGLRKKTAGNIEIFGLNLENNLEEIKNKIGVQLQSSAYYNFLTLREILDLFGNFYQKNINANKLLALVELEAKANSLVNNLSGGQRQRFSIIASLVNDPNLVFLDEPTTGLDPLARRNLWQLIGQIRDQGKTIVLTTHYLEEAEILCDRVAIMEKGKIIKIGPTYELIESSEHPYKINFLVPKINKDIFVELNKLGKIHNIFGKSNHFEMRLKSQKNLNQSLRLIQELDPESFIVTKASLEDLFIELTGKTISE